MTINNNSNNTTTAVKIMCHDHCHKTNNMLDLNNCLLEELIAQREQCGFSWGTGELPG